MASVGAIRFTLAAAVLAVLCRRSLASTPLRALLPPFVLGLTLYGLETGLFFASLERIDVSLASLVICSYPALVVAGAVLLGRERASKRRVVALVVALAGVALVLAGGVGGALDPVGVALALAAAVIYAAYVLVSDRSSAGRRRSCSPRCSARARRPRSRSAARPPARSSSACPSARCS